MMFSFDVFVQPLGGVYCTIPNFSVWQKTDCGTNKQSAAKTNKLKLNLLIISEDFIIPLPLPPLIGKLATVDHLSQRRKFHVIVVTTVWVKVLVEVGIVPPPV